MAHKISVVIPVYNVEKYVKECLDGILSSKENIEVIAVNDGSTDNSLAVLNSFNDERLKVFDKENEGAYKTWRFGVEKATGDYIVFVDSDDGVIPSVFTRINEISEEKEYDFIQFGWYNLYPDGRKTVGNIGENIKEGGYEGERLEELKRALLYSFDFNYLRFCRWARAFKADVLKRLLPNLIEKIRMYEDNCVTVPFISEINSAYLDNAPYYVYRYSRADSVTNALKNEEFYSDCKKLNEFFEENAAALSLAKETLDAQYFITNVCTYLRFLKSGDYEAVKRAEKDERFQELLVAAQKSGLNKRNATITKLFYKRKYKTLRLLQRANEVMKKLRRKG